MVDEVLPSSIMEGRVIVRSGIEKFEGSSVHFVDGAVIDNVDCVIFATGYELKFPFFKEEVIPGGLVCCLNLLYIKKSQQPGNVLFPEFLIIILLCPFSSWANGKWPI